MIRVQFNGNKAIQQVGFKVISDSVVQLTGDKIPRSTSGFKVFRLNGEFLGDYSDYVNVVEELENGVRFSK